MEFQQPIQGLFDQLTMALRTLGDEQYTRQNKSLFNATIGQHVRHIIELFRCLEKGYQTGIVNYEKRERDKVLETDRLLAVAVLSEIFQALDRPDKVLLLEANYNTHTEDISLVPTNYYREMIYNMEHTVHHMAMIRVGLNEISDIAVPHEFGVAASTIKHQKTCAP